jgi:hypothetical protein
MKPLSLVIALQLITTLALAGSLPRKRVAPTPPMERVLLPILGEFAEGTAHWYTDFELRNDNAFGVSMFFPFDCGIEYCPPPAPFDVEPGATAPFSRVGPNGVFLSVERRALADLTYTLRIKDVGGLSGTGPMLGAELPLVPEEDFRTAIHVVDIPTEPQSSSMILRIYELGISSSTVDVDIYSTVFNRDDLLVHEVVGLSGGSRVSGFDAFPAYAEVDLRKAIAGQPILQGRVTVWVRANDPATKIWAFVMVHDPDIRTPTVITPRR